MKNGSDANGVTIVINAKDNASEHVNKVIDSLKSMSNFVTDDLISGFRSLATETVASFNNIIAVLTQVTGAISQTIVTLFDAAIPTSDFQKKVTAVLGIIPDSLKQNVSSAVNAIDSTLNNVRVKVSQSVQGLAEGTGVAGDFLASFSGLSATVEIFSSLKEVSGGVFHSISAVAEEISFMSYGLESLKSLVATGPYQSLIQQNIDLRKSLIQTQSTLASTNKVIKGGEVVSDPTEAIKSLGAPVNSAIDLLRQQSLELVGVTSKDLIDVFRIVSSESSKVNMNLQQSADLTSSFAAAMGTLGIPLDQANQEIRSIMTATTDQNSSIAKALNLKNEELAKLMQQGKLYDFLTDKLKAFRAGNALSAQTFDGILSNIVELVDTIGLKAGGKLLDPLIENITAVYTFFQANFNQIQAFVDVIVGYVAQIGVNIADSFKIIAGAFGKTFSESILYLFSFLAHGSEAFTKALEKVMPILQPVIDGLSALIEGSLHFASGLAEVPLMQFAIALKLVSTSVGFLHKSFGAFLDVTPVFGEVLYLLGRRSDGLIGTFTNLTKTFQSFGLGGTSGVASTFLLTMKNLNSLPPFMGAGIKKEVLGMLGPLGMLGDSLSNLFPMMASGGIAVMALAQKFPFVQNALSGIAKTVPTLLSGLSGKLKDIGLSELSGLVANASAEFAGFANKENIAAIATEKLKGLLNSSQSAFGGMIKSAIGWSLGLGAAFLVFDELVLKNEGVKKSLLGLVQFLQNVVAAIQHFLTQPFVLATAAVIGLTVAIQNGLITSLIQTATATIELISANIMGWVTGFLSSVKGLSSGVQGASFDIKILTDVMKQIGSFDIGKFLKSFDLNTMKGAIDSVKLSLTELITVALPIALLVGIIASVTEAFQVYSDVVDSEKKQTEAFLSGIEAAEKRLALSRTKKGDLNDNGTAEADALAKRLKQIQNEQNIISKGFDFIRDAIKGLDDFLRKLPGVASFNDGIYKLMQKIPGIGSLLPADFKWTTGAENKLEAEKVGEVNSNIAAGKKLDDLKKTPILKEVADLDGKKKDLINQKSVADSNKDDYESNRLGSQIKDVEEEIAARRGLIDSYIEQEKSQTKLTDAGKSGQAILLKDMEAFKQKLAEVNNVSLVPLDLPKLGDTLTQLKTKADISWNAVLHPNGVASAFKEHSSTVIEFTQKLMEMGQISKEEALSRLQYLSQSESLDQDIQIKARQAITKIWEVESQKQIAIIQRQQAEVQALVKSGAIGEFAASQKASNLKIKELEQQQELAKKKQELSRQGNDLVGEEAAAEEIKKLTAEITSIKSEALQAQRKERLKDFDEQLSAAKRARSEGLLDSSQFAKAEAEISLNKNKEEIAQLTEQLSKLSGADKEGREAINAQIDELYAKQKEIRDKAFQEELNAVKEKFDRQMKIETQRVTKYSETGEVTNKAEVVQATSKIAENGVKKQIELVEEEMRKTSSTDEEKNEKLKSQKAELIKQLKEIQEKAYKDQLSAFKEQAEKEIKIAEGATTNSLQLAQKKLEILLRENDKELSIAKGEQLGEALKKRRELIQQNLQEQINATKEASDRQSLLLEQQFNNNELSESLYIQQSTEQKSNAIDQEIFLAHKALSLLKQNDQEGREKINAKIAELQKQKNDIVAEGQKKELDLLKRQQEKAFNLLIASENERAIQTQRLRNMGALSELDAEDKKNEASAERLKKQLDQEQDFIRKMESQKPLGDRVKEEERQKQIQDHRRKTQEITLQLLENEAKAWEVHTNKIVAELTRQDNIKRAGLQAMANQGQLAQEDIALEKAKHTVSLLKEQLNLEKDKVKQSELKLQLEEAQGALITANSNAQIAAINRANNLELSKLQSKFNNGKLTQEDIALDKAKQAILLLDTQLTLEKDQTKQSALKLQLEEAKGALIDAESNKLKSDIERSNQAIENSIKSQNQDLVKQQNLIEMANKALDMRSQIIQSQKNLMDAGVSYLTTEIDALAKTEQSEFKKKQLVEITAAIKLKAAMQQAKFDQESLNIEQAKQRLALEREEIANRIATAEAKLNVRKAEGALKVAAANPKTKAEDLEKLKIDVEIARDTLGLRQQEGGAIQSQKALQSQLQEREQQAAEFKRRSAITSAKSDAIEAIQNPGAKRLAQRQFQQDLLNDFGSSNINDLTDRGLSTASQIRKESGIGRNGLPGGITEEDNLRNILGEQDYQKSKLIPQGELDKRFGIDSVSAIPRPMNTAPLLLPQLDIPKMPIPTSATQGGQSVSVAPSINVTINANTPEGKEIGKNIETGVKPSLANVINEAHRLSLTFAK